MADTLTTEWQLDVRRANQQAKALSDTVRKVVRDLSDDIRIAIDSKEALRDVNKLGEMYESARSKSEELVASQKKALAAIVAAGQKGSAEYKALVKSLTESVTEAQKLASAASEIEEQFGNLDVGDVGKTLKTALAFDAASQAGAFLSQLDAEAEESKKGLRALQTEADRTGVSLSVMTARADDALRGGFRGGLAAARSGIATANQQLKDFLDPAEIDAFAARTSKLGERWDKDVNEIIGKSRTFISNFRLEGGEAGDLLALGLQDAGNGMDDVLDTMDEYSQLSAQVFGANKEGAQRFVGILTRGIQAGVRDTDKLADSVKEFQIRALAGDIDTALKDIQSPITSAIQGIVDAGEQGKISLGEVLQQSTAEIERAFNAGEISDTVRSQLQVALAGTPAEDIGSELFGRIFSAPIDTADIAARAKQAGASIDEAFQPTMFQKLTTELEILKTKAIDWAAPFIAGAGDVLQTVGQLGPAINLAFENKDAIKKFLLRLLTLIPGFGGVAASATAAGTASAAAGSAGATAWGAILGPITLVVAAIGLVVGAFVLLYKHSESFRQSVDNAKNRVTAFINDALRRLEPILQKVGQVLGAVGEIIVEGVIIYIEMLIFQFELMFDIATSIAGAMADFVSSLLGIEGPAVSMSDIFASLERILNDVKVKLEQAKFGLAGLRAGFQEVKDIVGEFIAAIGDGRLGDAFDIISRAGDRIGNATTTGERNAARLAFGLKLMGNVAKGTMEGMTKDFSIWQQQLKSGERSLKDLEAAINQERWKDINILDRERKALGLSNEDWAAVLNELNAEYDKFLLDLKKSTDKTKPTPNLGQAKKDIADLTDTYLSLFRQVEKTLSDVRIKGITDEAQRRRAEIEATRDQQITANNDALKKIEQQIQAAKDGVKIELELDGKKVQFTSKSDALAAFTKLYQELNQAARDTATLELGVAAKEFADKRLKDFLDREKAGRDAAIRLAEESEKAITGISEKEILERIRFQTDALKLRQQQELDEAIATLPEFAAESKRIQEQIASGTLATEEQIRAEYRRTLDALAATHPIALALIARFNADRIALERQVRQQIEDLRDSLIGGDAAKARAKALRELQRQHDREIAMVGDNEELKLAIKRRYNDAVLAIDLDYLGKSSAAYAGWAAFLTDIQKSIFDDSLTARQQAIKQELEDLEGRSEDIFVTFVREGQSYAQLQERKTEVNKELDRLTREFADAQMTTWDRVNRSVAAGFTAALDMNQTVLADNLKTYADAVKVGKDTSDQLIGVLAGAGTQVALTIGQAIGEQENLWKAGLKGLIRAAAGFLRAMAPLWSAQLFANAFTSVESVMTFGSAGFAKFAAMNAFLQAVISTAEALALSLFWKGGYTGDGGKYEARGVVHAGEFVHDQETTGQWRWLFEAIHRRKVRNVSDLATAIASTADLNKIVEPLVHHAVRNRLAAYDWSVESQRAERAERAAQQDQRRMAMMERAVEQAGTVTEIQALREDVRALSRQLKKLDKLEGIEKATTGMSTSFEKKYESFTHVDVGGETHTTVRGRDIIAVTELESRRRRRGR